MKRGFAHLVLLLVLLVVSVVVGAYFIRSSGKVSVLNQKKSGSASKVALQTTIKNPFDKNDQYVNPFSGYKNPFDTAK